LIPYCNNGKIYLALLKDISLILQLHTDADVVLDYAAAAKLPEDLAERKAYMYKIKRFYLSKGGISMMKVATSKFLKASKPVIKNLIEELTKDFSYVSVLGTDTYGKSYYVQRTGSGINDSSWNERGFVIRVHNGINYSEYSFNELYEDRLCEVIKHIKHNTRKQLEKLKEGLMEISSYPVIEEEEFEKIFNGEVKFLPEAVSSEEKLAKLSAIMNKGLKLSELMVDFEVSYMEVHISKIFISSKKNMEQSYVWSQGYIMPTVREGENTKYSYRGYSGLKGMELLEELEAGVDEVVDEAIKLLHADTIEPGEYDVICTPSVTGLIAHEAFGHGVEMDMFVKNRAKAVEYLGKSVASPLLTMTDGAGSAAHVSSYIFDDEGTLAGDTRVIKDGILQNGISDLLSALRLGTTPTGNGKRESFERKAYSRMTNTFFAPGSDKLEDMIGSISHGYLIDVPSSGMEDPKNWGIQCMLLRGTEIRDGKLTDRIVSPIIVTGYVPELLKSISMISGDFELYGTGACGKGYKEYVKTSDGGPYIKAKARLG
jgi:TldD protein